MSETEMKLKIGDRCWIKPWPLMVEQYGLDTHLKKIDGGVSFYDFMENELKGRNRICIISEITSRGYKVILDGNSENLGYEISDEMLIWPAFLYGEKMIGYDTGGGATFEDIFTGFAFDNKYPYKCKDAQYIHAKPLPKEEETVLVGASLYAIPEKVCLSIPLSEWNNLVEKYGKGVNL